MNNFRYIIYGDYGDWWKIYIGDTLLHYGNITVLHKEGNNLLMDLNYGTKSNFSTMILRGDNIILSVPIQPGMLEEGYIYQPLIFTLDEFKTLISHSYYDDGSLFHSLKEVSKDDLLNMWLLTAPNHQNYTDRHEMLTDIINSILFISDDIFDVTVIHDIIHSTEFTVKSTPKLYKSITIYIDGVDGVLEWNSLLSINGELYFRINENYYIEHK